MPRRKDAPLLSCVTLNLLGGSRTHYGTIPSKALRHSVKEVMQFNANPMFGDLGDARKLSFQQVSKHADRVVYEQVQMRTDFYDRNHTHIYKGRASFLDKNTIKLVGKRKKLSATNFVIATGSSPYHPPGIDLSYDRVFHNGTILNMGYSPCKVTVMGAGVIGCEYVSIFGGLGGKVELINPGLGLLTFLVTEIADALSYHLRNLGVRSRHNEEFEKMKCSDDHIVAYLKSGKKIRSDIVLWANGRRGNTKNLVLDMIGLTTNRRQQISVDRQYQTSVKNIYAAGDVIGWPSPAGAAYDQGRAASNAIAAPD